MKFADIEGNVREAQPGLTGKCRDCGHAVFARCGAVRIWHWAHPKSKVCDRWWEQETEWHRWWKNQFPDAWQEIGHIAQSGERHRADVKTESGLVLEFQHSPLSEAERVSREDVYPRLVWVVHANRRRDQKKFFASLSGPLRVASGLPTFTIFRDDSALLRDWGKSRAPVYFDFDETERVWRLIRLAARCWLMLHRFIERASSSLIAMETTLKSCLIRSSRVTARLPLPKPYRGFPFQIFPGIRHEECDASKHSSGLSPASGTITDMPMQSPDIRC